MSPYMACEGLLKTNSAPSEEVAQELRRWLVEPLQELEQINSDILDLRNRLLDLEKRQTMIQKRISPYKQVLSPLRRIPQEVLAEIFYHCLPTIRNPILVSSECPLLITLVCSSWRATAMITPKLWDRLYIPLTDDDTVPDQETLLGMAQSGVTVPGLPHAHPKGVKERQTEVLRRRYEAAREWLLRSGTRPLSLSLYLMGAHWYTVPYSERLPSATMTFLSFLASLAPRWKSFEIKSSMRMYRALESLLPPISQLTSLQYLRAEFYSQFPEHEGATQPLGLMQAPNLRYVSMSVGHKGVWGFAHEAFTQWNKLTHITSLRPFSLAESIFLFERAVNLVHFKGALFVQDPHVLSKGRISLLCLQSLSMAENYPRHLPGVHNLYDCIDAPELQALTYYRQRPSGDTRVAIPILPLLRRSTNLRYLCIDGHDLALWDLGAILRSVPSVTDLVIGQEESYSTPFQIEPLALNPRNMEPRNSSQAWNLDELLVVSDEESENDTPILPCLTSLLVSTGHASITDADLYDIIQSRMHLSAKTTVLERLKGVFLREIQRDVAKEIEHYAELVGIKMIDLDLLYCQRRPPTSDMASPAFGLKQRKDAPSWVHEDAGDTTYRWRGSKVPRPPTVMTGQLLSYN